MIITTAPDSQHVSSIVCSMGGRHK